jgi:hypothetical protein|tara:strand:+ start:390 stop:599 length:210 start_codon:yes stop_codon:yes gene_type:complete
MGAKISPITANEIAAINKMLIIENARMVVKESADKTLSIFAGDTIRFINQSLDACLKITAIVPRITIQK